MKRLGAMLLAVLLCGSCLLMPGISAAAEDLPAAGQETQPALDDDPAGNTIDGDLQTDDNSDLQTDEESEADEPEAEGSGAEQAEEASAAAARRAPARASLMSFEEYKSRYEAFISDDRFKNGAPWSGSQTPKTIGYSASGCCAYAVDYAHVVFGAGSQREGTEFTSAAEIQTGDIVHFTYPAGEHWIIVLTRNGQTLYTAEGAVGGKVRIGTGYYKLVGNELISQLNGDKAVTMMVSYHQNVQQPSFESAKANRICGANRYETAYAAAEQMLNERDGDRFDTVVIASGGDYPDALSGSYLAAQCGAPILLTSEAQVQTLLDRIGNYLNEQGRIFLLGGAGAVPESLDGALADRGYTVTRLAGANRFETNLRILEAAEQEGGAVDPLGSQLLVSSGFSYADSLSASAAGRPILLVGAALTDGQQGYLQQFTTKPQACLYIIGGEGAVSSVLQTEIESETGLVASRIPGANRYETSVNVANTFFGGAKVEEIVLAYGANFPDGLCGGPLAYSKGAPLILTSSLPAHYRYAYDYVNGRQVDTCYTLGGPTLISGAAIDAIMARTGQ